MTDSKLIIAALCLLALTSCQKKYICECSSGLISSYNKTYTIRAKSAFEAQKKCSSNTSEFDGTGKPAPCQIR